MKFRLSHISAVRFLLVFACGIFCVASPGHAAEGVEKWSTELRFSKDGSVLITEEIVAMVAQGEIARGGGHLLPRRAGVFYKQTADLAYEPLLGFIDNKTAAIVIETKQATPQITVRQEAPLSAGLHVYLLQYKVNGTIIKDAQADAFAWPVVSMWKGGVRRYQVKIVPPEFMEPQSLVVRLLRRGGEKIVSKQPALTFQDGAVQLSGDAVQDGMPLVLGVNFPKGFFN